MNAPNVLVLGSVLGQSMGGVYRHNAEILPRAAELLRAGGGSLTVLEGALRIKFALPDSIARIETSIPFQPPFVRARAERSALAQAIEEAKSKGRPFDLVHTAHLPAPKALAVPYTYTIHDLRSLDFSRAPFVRRFVGGRVIRSSLAGAAAIGVVSESMRARLAAEWPELEARICVIGNGVDHLSVLPREPAEGRFMVSVGHIEARKNLEVVLRAMALEAELPDLLLLGQPKAFYLDSLLETASSLGVEHRVRVEEEAGDARLASAYASATCAVFPSLVEGFGIGPAEALRAGCPVAASAIPAHVEITRDAACLFDPADATQAARAIADAIAQGSVPSPPAMPDWHACAERFTDMLGRGSR